MTRAFDIFMHQYNMTGGEKADGYSRAAFTGLVSDEQEEVFRLLMREIPFSVEWMFFLNADRALAIAKQYEAKWRGDGSRHVYILQQQIVAYSGDLLYQQRMIEDYPHYLEHLRAQVIDAVHRTPSNAATKDFFQQVVLTEQDDDAAVRACRHLLNDAGFYGNNDSYGRLLTALRNDNVATRLAALSEIKNIS